MLYIMQANVIFVFICLDLSLVLGLVSTIKTVLEIKFTLCNKFEKQKLLKCSLGCHEKLEFVCHIFRMCII